MSGHAPAWVPVLMVLLLVGIVWLFREYVREARKSAARQEVSENVRRVFGV